MAGTRKVGEKIPLAVVGKDGIKEDGAIQEETMTEDERQTTISHLTENLKSLRAQVEQLSSSLAEVSGKAGKAVVNTAGAATDTVTSTVRTYPFYTVFAASALAFLLGRLTVTPAQSPAERTLDHLLGTLRDARARLPSHLAESLKSSFR